jgi:hypothetical protein
MAEEEPDDGANDGTDRRTIAARERSAEPGGAGGRGDDPVAGLFDERELPRQLLLGGTDLFQAVGHRSKEYICRLLIIWN